jgi:hypothetical protein
VDVVSAAWAAAGRPQPHPSPGRTAPCARCARPGALTPVTEVVSRKFTGWDGWADLASPGLCPPCTWAYRTKELRTSPAIITAAPLRLEQPALACVARILAARLPARTAVLVPLHPGRKHLLPSASWGTITTGEATFGWTAGDADRLQALTRLRHDGFGTRMLARPAPAYAVLRRLADTRRGPALDDWTALRPWRERRPWLTLALCLTTPAASTR